MFTKYTTAIIALAGLVSAMPANQPRILQHDDVILPRADGGFDIMKDWEWSDVERRLQKEARDAATEAKRRSVAGEDIPLGALRARDAGLQRRGCEESEEVQVLSDTQFTDWDVAMSPVVGATGGQALLAVSKGYSVSNSVSVSASEDVTIIPDVLKASYSISVSESWETTDSQTFTFYITPGQYGVVVSNPYVRRLTGNYLSGCTDSPTTESFQSDSHSSQTYGDLSWVTGPIRLCNSTSYPVPYCVGTGSHQ